MFVLPMLPPATTLATATDDAFTATPRMHAEDLSAGYGRATVLRNISLSIPERGVTAIIGPSGCGKSTFLRCLNRMHELTPGAFVKGHVFLGHDDIYGRDINPVRLRRHVGMVFQKPNPFPSMSIRDNVLAGFRLNRLQLHRDRTAAAAAVEKALTQAALWDEVKDRLNDSALSLSGGQQQRLCIARSLALEPTVLLMDEPCSALDPIATARIEELITELKQRLTIVMVTHNMQQARRVADNTAFFYQGELIEAGPTARIFESPREERTAAYVAGRFG
jgi:phosphate transport system ATP-binding protein